MPFTCHGIEIVDSALVTGTSQLNSIYFTYDFLSATIYSAHYTSDQYLSDKVVDLIDKVTLQLWLYQESKPNKLNAFD